MKQLLPFLSLLLLATISRGQDNTLYFMRALPQSIQDNPAFQPKVCKFYIELPVISSLEYAYNNTGFGYHDVLHYGDGLRQDSLVVDLDELYNSLRAVNYIRNDLSFNVLGFGIKLKEGWYASLSIRNHTETRIGFARDVIAATKGNWNSDTDTPRILDFSGFGITARNYFDIGLGASKQLQDGSYWGAKIKYLIGVADITTAESSVLVNTYAYPLAIEPTATASVNASFPVDLVYGSDGYISDFDFSRIMSDPLHDYLLNQNRGWAVDLGFSKPIDDKLSVSASVVDLGYINWKSNVTNYQGTGYFYFDGIDLDLYEAGQFDGNLVIANLIDSLQNSFMLTSGSQAYKTSLTTKFFAAAHYQIHPMLELGVLSKNEVFDKKMHPSVTLSGAFTPWNWLTASMSYSYMNYSFNNLGFGLALGSRVAQFYVISDNIPLRYVQFTGTPLIWPYNARSMNIRVGLNLVLGCHKKVKGKNGSGGGRPTGIRPRNDRNTHCPAYY